MPLMWQLLITVENIRIICIITDRNTACKWKIFTKSYRNFTGSTSFHKVSLFRIWLLFGHVLTWDGFYKVFVKYGEVINRERTRFQSLVEPGSILCNELYRSLSPMLRNEVPQRKLYKITLFSMIRHFTSNGMFWLHHSYITT